MHKYNQALRYEIFEKEEYALAKEAIKQAEVIFDIGGHLGYFSEWCRSLNEKAEIHYFEPVPVLYQEAKERLKEDKKLIFNNVGIGTKEETIPFLLNEEKTMQSSKYSSFLNMKGEEITVKMTSLTKYFSQQNPPYLPLRVPRTKLRGKGASKEDLIVKLDIEGMEFEVLESRGDEMLGNIGSLIIEIHLLNEKIRGQFEAMKQRLETLGYSLQEQEHDYSKDVLLLFATK